MNCEEIKRRDLVEEYLLGQLDDAEREEFELHFLGCDRCLEDLRVHDALREQLSRSRAAILAEVPRQGQAWYWVAVAATCAAAAVVIGTILLWPRQQGPLAPPIPPPTAQATQPTPPPPKPPPAPVEKEAPEMPTLAELARVEPPPYTAMILRGPTTESLRTFRAAMRQYTAGDYAGAIPGLREACRLDPEAANAAFYLGVCYLLTDQNDRARQELVRTVSLGESPYLEATRFYLAKAYLRANDVAAARSELGGVMQMHGDLEARARRLLSQLNARQKP